MKKVTILLMLFGGLFFNTKAQTFPDSGEKKILNIGGIISERLHYEENWISSTTMIFKLMQWTEVGLSISNLDVSGYTSEISLILENNSTGESHVFPLDYSNTEFIKKLSPGNYTVSINPFKTVILTNNQLDPIEKPEPPLPLIKYITATVTVNAMKSISRPPEEYIVSVDKEVSVTTFCSSENLNRGNLRFLPFVAISPMTIMARLTDISIDQRDLSRLYFTIYKNPLNPEIIYTMLVTDPDSAIYPSGSDTEVSVPIIPIPDSEAEEVIPAISISEGTYVCELSLEPPTNEAENTSSQSTASDGGLPILQFSRLTVSVKGEIPEDAKVEYTYDSSGNCTGRNVIILQSSAKLLEQEQKQEDLPIFEDKQVNVKIYPNPTRGQLKVEIPEFQYNEAVVFSIYDMSGRLYKNQKATESIVDLDLSSYSAGTYILRMNRNGKYSSWRIIKIN